jgi:hypothetical protein
MDMEELTVMPNGNQIWKINGIVQRNNDLPAFICRDGNQMWINNGKPFF